MTKQKEQAVIVTTEFRGVFFGYMNESPANGSITIKRARNCVYWSTEVRGFMDPGGVNMASERLKEMARDDIIKYKRSGWKHMCGCKVCVEGRASFAEQVVREAAQEADDYPRKSSDTELSVGQVVLRHFGLADEGKEKRC